MNTMLFSVSSPHFLARHICGLLILAATISSAISSSSPYYPSPWGSGGPDGWDEAYAKAAEFVQRLSLVEKVNLTTGTGNQADLCTGNTGSIPRLGFRHICLQDGPVGVRYSEQFQFPLPSSPPYLPPADLNSVFPAGISAAATWSRRLLRARGLALGAEFRDKGVDVLLGPVVGPLGRDPAGGRNWEGFGPDPYLAGVAVGETVAGTQEAGVVASVKHYVLNEQEHFRGSISSIVDDRTMHQLYLWPFADAVRAGVGSVMCSYNRINGTFACESPEAINRLLKNELSFQGFVVSDWGAQHSGVPSTLSGLDMTMPGEGAYGEEPTFSTYGSYWGGALTEAVLNGTVPQWRLDDMVMRIMAAFYKVGRDEKRVDINFSAWTNETIGPRYWKAKMGNTTVNRHVDVQADGAHAALIREMGAKGTVLLKNTNNALPLSNPTSIAVIGEDAQDNSDGPNACVDRICNNGTLAMGWGSATAEYPYLISPATALETRAEADGTRFTNVRSNFDLDAARAAVSDAEVAVVFVNANSGEGYQVLDGNLGDRNNLTLWRGGDELVDTVAATNPNTIVVIHSVGPVLIEHIRTSPNVSAILWAGLPGQESGNSLVDVLYGDVEPQGRTPFTWGKAAGDWGISTLTQSGPFGTVPVQEFEEGLFIDYRYFDREGIEPSFEFGFGLGYTNFTYSNLTITSVVDNYTPTTGQTAPAPTFGSVDFDDTGAALMPQGFSRIPGFIYPWLAPNASLAGSPGEDDSVPDGSRDGSPQDPLPAGGAPGGNSGLYETVFVVSILLSNTGGRAGTEIPQLYISHGGPDDPKVVLRGFDEVALDVGATKEVLFNLTRRDVSSWDTVSQNWVITPYEKTVYVGASSRDFKLQGKLGV